MKGLDLAFAAAMLGVGVILAMATFVQSQDVPRIAKEEVREILKNPDVIIIDVRQQADWKASDEKIQGAVREDPDTIISVMEKYPKDKTLIFYCA